MATDKGLEEIPEGKRIVLRRLWLAIDHAMSFDGTNG